MIYGATGYTGKLCAEEAVKRGLQPILAGRSEDSLRKIADPLGLQIRAFGLGNPVEIVDGLQGVDAVLHCAGPFLNTAAPMVLGCIKAGCHYLDITGEPDVFADHVAIGAEAQANGVMVLPGCGFDVVPTDSTAAMLVKEMPDATEIILAFAGLTQPSRGSLRTVLKDVAKPQMCTKDGKMQPFTNAAAIKIDFGNGLEKAVPNTWGDLVTAPVSTGVGNVAVYFVPPASAKPLLAMPQFVKQMLATGAGQAMLNWYIDRKPAGPDADELSSGRARVFGRATNANGDVVESLIETPEAYALTAISAVELLSRAGTNAVPGFQTPSLFAGADFVLTLPGVRKLAV